MSTSPEEKITQAAIERLEAGSDGRLREVLVSLTKHLHAFIRDVEPSEEEWMAGIQFLTATGQMCDDKRQEFILLSDTLGVSMLVDAISHRKPAGATESSVLGPFYREGAPVYPKDSDLAAGATEGEPIEVAGRVLDVDGAPIAKASLDVWQTAPNEEYSAIDASQPAFNLCGKLTTDEEGRYAFRTLKPVSYTIPSDGPVGAMLRAAGRHPWRPAHIHFKVSADGYETLVTQLFTDDDPYLESDAVFGVKESLVVHYEPTENGGSRVDYDFVMKPAD
jgi:catechol 1,2-dioxygenase